MDDRRTEGHDHTPFGGSSLGAFRSPPYPFPDIPPYNVKTLHFHGVPTTEDTQHAWGYTFTTVVLHDALGDADVRCGGWGGFTFRRVRVLSVHAGERRNAE